MKLPLGLDGKVANPFYLIVSLETLLALIPSTRLLINADAHGAIPELPRWGTVCLQLIAVAAATPGEVPDGSGDDDGEHDQPPVIRDTAPCCGGIPGRCSAGTSR
jgi:hypothetical protein